jgi:hypothetical protein
MSTTAQKKTKPATAEAVEVKEASEVVVNTPEVITAPPIIVKEKKDVIVIPKFSGSRFIAGTWYNFTNGKETAVPENVKAILLNADAIRI